MTNFYFIAVNYNNFQLTEKYAQSIEKFNADNHINIIIVDNNSEEQDYKALKKSLKDIKNLKIIRNNKNIGYFAGLNTGITSVGNKKDSIFIVGNNDIEFKNNFLSELDKIKYDDNVCVIAPNIITLDGYNQNPHYINKLSRKKKLFFKIYFSNYYICKVLLYLISIFKKFSKKSNKYCNSEMIIYQGVGACYILTANFFKFYSKLDDGVFLWGEEALLAHQLESINGKMLYSPNMVVYHKENLSVNRIKSKEAYKIGQESYSIYSKYI